MPVETFKIEGLKELDKALSELPQATSRTIQRNTLRQVAKPVVEMGSNLAPWGTGALAESYKISSKLSPRQRRSTKKESPVEVYIGPGPNPQAIQTEFGNAHQAPEPHLRPAWDANERGVLNGIKTILADKIEKARRRLARKAAKLKL